MHDFSPISTANLKKETYKLNENDPHPPTLLPKFKCLVPLTSAFGNMSQPIPPYYLITGRKDTGTFNRLEIEDLQLLKPKQFTLFILAYLQLQGRDGDQPYPPVEFPPAAQFANIAGIHGLPFQVNSITVSAYTYLDLLITVVFLGMDWRYKTERRL
jgi:hypothetical protein